MGAHPHPLPTRATTLSCFDSMGAVLLASGMIAIGVAGVTRVDCWSPERGGKRIKFDHVLAQLRDALEPDT